MDVVRRVVVYVVARLGEVDVKRLMYIMYLVDRELFYVAGFTLFLWRYTFGGLRSFDVYDVADELVDLGYFDKVVEGKDIVYRLRRKEVEVELHKQLRDVVDKVLVKVEGDVNLEEYVARNIDPNVVKIAGV
ncbi:MAG: hypothetical protein ACO2O1_02705 [Candidatus Caldarchaeales archaeon]